MKTCPLTILVSLAIVMYFLLDIFFSYSKETYFNEDSISENLPIAFGSVVGILVLEQLFAKEPRRKLIKKEGKLTFLIDFLGVTSFLETDI
jgi:hypothetical protein